MPRNAQPPNPPAATATPRTRTGARLVGVTEYDPVTERGRQFDAAFATYTDAQAKACEDYRAACTAAWQTYEIRLAGLAAEHTAQVDAIRAGTARMPADDPPAVEFTPPEWAEDTALDASGFLAAPLEPLPDVIP